MSNYFEIKKAASLQRSLKIVKLLVKCPKCKSEFYIDEKLINVNGQQCRICGKQVKLKIQ